MQTQVLLVDDELNLVRALRANLATEAYDIFTATSAGEAFAILKVREIDVIVADDRMPGIPGSELLSVVQKRWPDTIRILLTGTSELSASDAASRKPGIYRVLCKPSPPLGLGMEIRKALELRELMSAGRRMLSALQRLVAAASPGDDPKVEATKTLQAVVHSLVSETPASLEDLETVLGLLRQEIALQTSR
jgi:two-component system response regulator HupR/HoxA